MAKINEFGNCSNCGTSTVRKYHNNNGKYFVKAYPVMDDRGLTEYICTKCKKTLTINGNVIKSIQRFAHAINRTKIFKKSKNNSTS